MRTFLIWTASTSDPSKDRCTSYSTWYRRSTLDDIRTSTKLRTPQTRCSSYVCRGLEVSMANDLVMELRMKKWATWGAFSNVEEVTKQTRNVRLTCEEESRERCLEWRDSRRCLPCWRSKIRGAVIYTRSSKIRWTGYVKFFVDTRRMRAITDWIPCDF